MARKKHIWHCSDGFPAKVTKGSKRTKYLIDPRDGQVIAYYNLLPLLAAAVPLAMKAAPAVSGFIGSKKKEQPSQPPNITASPQISEQYYKNKYTTEERIHDALR